MARLESKVIMGYLPVEERHYQALFSLVTPATADHKLLDPMAGAGEFLAAAAQAWHITPYANELDHDRARECIARFGPQQAVQGDVERLSASTEAFGLLWVNPPYDHDAQATDNKRVEFRYLRHSWKWAQAGAVVMWVVYQQHLTEAAAEFLAKHSAAIDVWALPGKHLNTYDQIVVVAVKGLHPEPEQLYHQILQGKADPLPLIPQPEPLYKLPKPRQLPRFTFAPDQLTPEAALRLIETQGAWQAQGFQALFNVPTPPEMIRPIVPPRPGHTALVLAAGIADGAVIDTETYGTVAIRGKTSIIRQLSRVEVENDPQDPEQQIKKTTHKLKPSTTLNLLAQDGTRVEMAGDEALLTFITENKTALAGYLNDKFNASYDFDMNGMGGWLSALRLKGKYELYTAQKHVIAAVTEGFETRKGILLIGAMGVGKTALGSSVALGVACGVAQTLHQQMRPDQVTLIVAPPHLIDKWKREILSLNRHAYVERLDRHEDVKAFMTRAELLGGKVPKIGLIKRDMTKLGAGFEPAVSWRQQPVALWSRHQETPVGYEPNQRIVKQRLPQCPTCGETVMQEKNDQILPVTASWLKSGKRTCRVCHAPLWQTQRDSGSRPKAGEKYPTKNPRYRLDEYLKRVYPDRVFLLIWDEAHEAQHGDTGNGQSFGRMAGSAQKVLAMTGTPFNGRSSSLFNLEYHLNPRIRQRFNWGGASRFARKARGSRSYAGIVSSSGYQRGRAESAWVDTMGVREQVIEERPTYDKQTGAYTGTATYERPYQEAPGISPLLVAEVLDHSVFFSLGDLGKALPQYEEIALPVEMDSDTYEQYDRTRALLKDYLIQRRWEGDATFRGAYLQWSMGWVNRPHLPEQVIHNLKDPFSTEKHAHIVTQIPSFGADRIYAKEQALIDLVKTELAADRPCVVYVRQTVTNDIQPRLEQLLRQHIPEAQPFILRNSVSAERREKVIEAERAKGMNVLICNPELVKTGLDLLFTPTLIFYEITFNLSTMMQAAARAYRLNQTHNQCKTVYLYYEGTMEQTAVQLMSRKQRAAKLLTGELGLTGLESLTDGEGGLEEALMDAIGKEASLLDPSAMFKADSTAIDSDDLAFWAAEITEESPVKITPIEAEKPLLVAGNRWTKLTDYLDEIHLIYDDEKRIALQNELLQLVKEQPEPAAISAWLKANRFVFAGCEDESAAEIIRLSGHTAPASKIIAFEAFRKEAKSKPRRKVDLSAAPEVIGFPPPVKSKRKPIVQEQQPLQLALF